MVQEFVSNLLLTIINRIFQNTTHLYYALGATVLVLVASYFIYKWYFASPPVQKTVAFEETHIHQAPSKHSKEGFQEESMPEQEEQAHQEEGHVDHESE